MRTTVAIALLLVACVAKPSSSRDDSGGSGGTSGTGGEAGTSGTGGVGGDVDAGGDDAGGADGGVDAGPDAALPCGVECTAPNAHCHEASMTCVQCLITDDCDSGVCDLDSHSCVTCTTTEGCSGSMVCDVPNHTCVECNNSTDCNGSDVCVTGGHDCVECNSPSDCTADNNRTQCADDNTCVQCIEDSDCTDPAAAKCSNNQCVPCDNNTQCTGKLNDNIAANVCDTSDGPGQCVQCTATNETACGNNSCNPATNRCTNTPRTSVQPCERCVADSECAGGQQYRCIPMSFNGTPRADGYCLRAKGNADCTRPYRVLITATSLSGVPSAEYCGINEALTTCEAVLDRTNGQSCANGSGAGDASLCGAPGLSDGVCETVGGADFQCTYPCSETIECPGTSLMACTMLEPYCH